MNEPTTCRSCHADVIFVPSAKTGKPMILDAAPKKLVVVVLDLSAHFIDEAFEFAPPGEMGSEARVVDVYTPHHATCPSAKAWAGRNRSNPPAPQDTLDPVVVREGEAVRGHARGAR